jgi:hypothetical protein
MSVTNATYLGDFTLGATFDFKFNTTDLTDTTVNLTGGTVACYPDNSTTEITAGVTLTVTFDGRTGLHNVRIVATSGNGYAAATNYAVVLTAGTVDTISVVGRIVAHFSIQNRSSGAGGSDPWSTALPGAYGAGTAGNIVGTNLNATVSSRASQTSVDAKASQTSVDAVQADTDNLQTRLPAALVGGKMDATVAGVATSAAQTTAQTDLTAIKAKTDTLPTDPADASVIAASFATLTTAIGNLNDLSAAEVWDAVIEGAVTARQSLRLANSANGAKTAGPTPGTAGTVTIRDLADGKARVTAPVDSNGYRTAVTLDLT